MRHLCLFFWRGTDYGLVASGTYRVINAPSCHQQRLFVVWLARCAIAEHDALSDTVEDLSTVFDHRLHGWRRAKFVCDPCIVLLDRGFVPFRSRR